MARKRGGLGGSGTERDADRLWDSYIDKGLSGDQLTQLFAGVNNTADLENKVKILVWGSSARRSGKRTGPKGWNTAYSTLLDRVVGRAYKKMIYDSKLGQQTQLIKFPDSHIQERKFRIQNAEAEVKNYKELYNELNRSMKQDIGLWLSSQKRKRKAEQKIQLDKFREESGLEPMKRQVRKAKRLKYRNAAAKRLREEERKTRTRRPSQTRLPEGRYKRATWWRTQLRDPTQRDSIRAQRGAEQARVTRNLRSTQPSPLTPKRQVSAQNYSSYIRQSQVTNSNTTARLLNDLQKLEHKTRRKSLSQYK